MGADQMTDRKAQEAESQAAADYFGNYDDKNAPPPSGSAGREPLHDILHVDVDVDDFDGWKHAVGGRFNEMLNRLYSVAASDRNGRAIVVTATDWDSMLPTAEDV